MTENLDTHHSYPPVVLDHDAEDSVEHSLALLSTVYHYNHWIFDSLRDFMEPKVLEVGPGTGNITQFLLNHDEVVCLEPYEPYRKYLESRFQKHLNVSTYPYRIEDVPNSEVSPGRFDSVLCINVLEHIEDDVAALERMRQMAAPGRRVIVFVPGLQRIYGAMDKGMGHFRRYDLSSLRRVFRAAGLKPLFGRYMNMPGALAWWWQGRVKRRQKLPVGPTKLFDRMVPFVSAVERLIPVFFGQSVYLIGES